MSNAVLEFHNKTKHRFEGYAPSPGFLDWDNQPDPFRCFVGSPITKLDLIDTSATLPESNLSMAAISHLFQFSLGLTGWKSLGPDSWSMRVNPSSGNLHPTEAYLVLWHDVESLKPGIYHYNAYHHQLETRCQFDEKTISILQNTFRQANAAIALTTISWREEWKYGPRAYRYCQLDVGHAMGSLAYSAALQGLKITEQPGIDDDNLSSFLGLNRKEDFVNAEKEDPDALLILSSNEAHEIYSSDQLTQLCDVSGNWFGQASIISNEHLCWNEIQQLKPAVNRPLIPVTQHKAHSTISSGLSARTLIGRRSAQRMDKKQSKMQREQWLCMLESLSTNNAVNACYGITNHVSLLVVAHDVVDTQPGFYFLSRNDQHMRLFRQSTQCNFLWDKEGLGNLSYLQAQDETRKMAAKLSCYQGIAAHGSFCVFMLADMRQIIEQGAWMYRNLHIEAGLLGQQLYIEAEKAGFNGTGIGCFFDDEVQRLLGLPSDFSSLQVIYHFTVGKARVDDRLESQSAYHHLDDSRKLSMNY